MTVVAIKEVGHILIDLSMISRNSKATFLPQQELSNREENPKAGKGHGYGWAGLPDIGDT